MKLSITLMVSNSIDTIKKCMESLQPILMNVESELIVVDTGGRDGSIEVAKEYASKIIPFTWCNDFAKARNAGLFAASGEWIMYLDDDEWFENADEIVDFFNSGEYQEFQSASYAIRNYTDYDMKQYVNSRRCGIVRRVDGLKFVRPIHETLNFYPKPEKYLNSYEHHFGYVYKNQEEKIAHVNRNLNVLKEEVRKHPNDHHYILQIAQEYHALDDYETMKNYCLSGVKRLPVEAFNQRTMVGWMAANVINADMFRKDYQSAFAYAKKYIKLDWLQHLAKAFISYKGVLLSSQFQDIEMCKIFFDIMQENILFLRQNEDIFHKEEIFELGEVMKPQIELGVYCYFIPILTQAGRYEDAVMYAKQLIERVDMHDYSEKTLTGEDWTMFEKIIGDKVADGLKTAFDTNTSELQRLRALKQITDIYPKMAEFCQYLISKFSTSKENLKNDKQSLLSGEETKQTEFEQLAIKVKEMIYHFADNGDRIPALQTLQQLEALTPDDPEIEQIRQMLKE